MHLHRAFQWVEFAHASGKVLYEAFRGRLAMERIPGKEVHCCATSASRNEPWRFVWLDSFWYLPEDGSERASFVALSYHSSDFEGSHLVLGVADLAADADVISKPTHHGQWILDYAFGSTDHPKKVSSRLGVDGLIEHLPGPEFPKICGSGVRKLVSAPFPVAWFQHPGLVDTVAAAFLQLVNACDGSALGRLSGEARSAATASASE